MIYRETYPQCADCPYLANLQERRNTHVAKIEKAEADTIDWELRAITEDMLTQVTGEEIAELLDRMKQLDEEDRLTPDMVTARDELLVYYARLDKEVGEYSDMVKQRIAWHQEYVSKIQGMLPDYDTVASLITEYCEGHQTIGSVACLSIARPDIDTLFTS